MDPPSDAPRDVDALRVLRPRPRPRLLAVDVDGTLLTSRHEVSPASAAEVARVRAHGVEVVLVSARGPGALRTVLDSVGSAAGSVFVASQGAVTGRCAAGGGLDVLDRRPMPVEPAHRVVAMAADEGLTVSWFAGSDWYVSRTDQTIVDETRVVGVEPEVRDVAALDTGPDKITIVAPGGDRSPLSRIAARLPAGLRAHVSNPTYLEITRADVDKAVALQRYCRRRRIAGSDVVAIGDGPNDLGLFAFAGVSIAPASARPEVLAAASYVTSTNDTDGVARALRALVP